MGGPREGPGVWLLICRDWWFTEEEKNILVMIGQENFVLCRYLFVIELFYISKQLN